MPPTPSRPRPTAGPPPGQPALHEAALAHLARFAVSEAGLVRVLDRRVDRWARRAAQNGHPEADIQDAVAAGRTAARAVARALTQAGILDDAAYAGARARSLARAGRSRRATLSVLAAKGVPAALARDALPDPDAELASALAYAKRRRIGPFRVAEVDADIQRREIAALARAGFPAEIAGRAMRLDPEEAEALVNQLRQG